MSLADKPFHLSQDLFKQIKFISPNIHELRKIAETFNVASTTTSASNNELKIENVHTSDDREKIFREIADLCRVIENRIDNIIVSVGQLGVFVCRSNDSQDPFFSKDFTYLKPSTERRALRHYPGNRFDNVVNASGAGDAFCSGFMAAMLKNKPESICVSVGLAAAVKTLMSKRAVPADFFDENHSCWTSPASFDRIV